LVFSFAPAELAAWQGGPSLVPADLAAANCPRLGAGMGGCRQILKRIFLFGLQPT